MTDVKKSILSRRARFIAATIAGSGLVVGCSEPTACLDIAAPPEDAATQSDAVVEAVSDASTEDAWPQGCLEMPLEDATPDGAQVCLSMVEDATPDGPQVCLSMVEDASADSDAAPQVCLDMDPDADPQPCLKIAPDATSDI